MRHAILRSLIARIPIDEKFGHLRGRYRRDTGDSSSAGNLLGEPLSGKNPHGMYFWYHTVLMLTVIIKMLVR
jgi:hypothetical protein